VAFSADTYDEGRIGVQIGAFVPTLVSVSPIFLRLAARQASKATRHGRTRADGDTGRRHWVGGYCYACALIFSQASAGTPHARRPDRARTEPPRC
jgi:hypothetical protein